MKILSPKRKAHLERLHASEDFRANLARNHELMRGNRFHGVRSAAAHHMKSSLGLQAKKYPRLFELYRQLYLQYFTAVDDVE